MWKCVGCNKEMGNTDKKHYIAIGHVCGRCLGDYLEKRRAGYVAARAKEAK